MNDLILRQARVVRSHGIEVADLAINGETITEIAPTLSGSARVEIAAENQWLFPGFIDAHVHFNEPGRADWEGLETGSLALAAGGGTCFFDMPLNSDPPVLDVTAFEAKRQLAEEKSRLDFALWGGLCPGYLDAIEPLAAAGAIGLKAFMPNSGIAEFPAVDPETLRKGMIRAARVNLLVAVHAEDSAILERAQSQASGTTLRDFFASRPQEAESTAVRIACELAGETGCRLHVVHVSCVAALAEIEKARKAGVDVTAETCPHYLLFDEARAETIGARAKCAPPLRPADEVAALRQALREGRFDTVGSDHSPAPPAMKLGEDFFQIWGGIAGCQHAWPALVGSLAPEDYPLAAALIAENVGRRFGLQKGRIDIGSDADFALLEIASQPPIQSTDLKYRHAISLYEGFRPGARVQATWRRGERLADSVTSRGKFLRP